MYVIALLAPSNLYKTYHFLLYGGKCAYRNRVLNTHIIQKVVGHFAREFIMPSIFPLPESTLKLLLLSRKEIYPAHSHLFT
jgi:hypothetical protein